MQSRKCVCCVNVFATPSSFAICLPPLFRDPKFHTTGFIAVLDKQVLVVHLFQTTPIFHEQGGQHLLSNSAGGKRLGLEKYKPKSDLPPSPGPPRVSASLVPSRPCRTTKRGTLETCCHPLWGADRSSTRRPSPSLVLLLLLCLTPYASTVLLLCPYFPE